MKESKVMVQARVLERFWKSVKKSKKGCWLWTGGKNKAGYGWMFLRKEGKAPSRKTIMILAHRMSYWIRWGVVSKLVRHTCHTPACVRPSHLLWGTDKDNVADMFAAKRDKLTGERNPRSILTNKIVKDIRRLAKQRWTVREIHTKYENIRLVTLHQAITGATWKHLPDAVRSPESYHLKPEQRVKIVQLVIQGFTQNKVAEITGTSQASVANVWRVFRQEGGLNERLLAGTQTGGFSNSRSINL